MADPRYSYDEECERLARHFLADDPDATDEEARDLAQWIQNNVEDWLSFQLGRQSPEYKQAIEENNSEKRFVERQSGGWDRGE